MILIQISTETMESEVVHRSDPHNGRPNSIARLKVTQARSSNRRLPTSTPALGGSEGATSALLWRLLRASIPPHSRA